MIERYRTEVLEREYQEVIKSTLKFMISNKAACLSLALNGVQMEYYKRKHPEIFEIFQKLISSKQLELLGGGYYESCLSSAFSKGQDRADRHAVFGDTRSHRKTPERTFNLRKRMGFKPCGKFLILRNGICAS